MAERQDREDGGFTFYVYDAHGHFLLGLNEADFRHPTDDPAGTARDTAALMRRPRNWSRHSAGPSGSRGTAAYDEAVVALEKAGVTP